MLDENLQHKVKSSPDFIGAQPDRAKQEFIERIRKYEAVYKQVLNLRALLVQKYKYCLGERREISDDSLSYVKVINLYSIYLLY